MTKDFHIQRCITFYKKNKKVIDGERVLLEEELALDDLRLIFDGGKDDSLLYKQYNIDSYTAGLINQKVEFDFDFDNFDYFLETFNVSIDSEIGKGVRKKDS